MLTGCPKAGDPPEERKRLSPEVYTFKYILQFLKKRLQTSMKSSILQYVKAPTRQRV
jgi:hypothetical protein